jgi:Ser/Thr protein kinase RdoA (MazF antagonist)
MDAVERPSQFEDCGFAFGQFAQQLADFPAHTLHEVIVKFHDTRDRYRKLEEAIARDAKGRAKDVAQEIAFARAHSHYAPMLFDAMAQGILPLRVTHNDTKLNNILFDAATQKPMCVIDLDTVMPGFSAYDFGDSIRFGANTAAEDETDLSKVQFDLELFEAYARGYLKGCNGAMGADEIALLPVGAILMTLECGVRFLTDYLDGDVYFRIHRPSHNLDRCRTQFRLVAEMEKHRTEMDAIMQKYQ